MDSDIVGQTATLFNTYVVPLGWKLAGAVAVWIVGGWVIRLVRAAIERTLLAQKVDHTLAGYIEASANVMLKLLLFIAVLSVLGIETTSFAALLAALGLAIGAAWCGTAREFRGRHVSHGPAPVQGRRHDHRRRSDRGRARDRPAGHRGGHGRQHSRLRRQQQAFFRLDPELHDERLPPRRPESAGRAQRESVRRDQAAVGAGRARFRISSPTPRRASKFSTSMQWAP